METTAEKSQALQRGKATSSVIGPRALGERFNILMTIQVPLQQGSPASFIQQSWNPPVGPTMLSTTLRGPPGHQPPAWFSGTKAPTTSTQYPFSGTSLFGTNCAAVSPANQYGDGFHASMSSTALQAKYGVSPICYDQHIKTSNNSTSVGISKVARVSRGSIHDTWSGLRAESYVRDHNQHITVTIVLYHIVEGGVPSETDVIAAIDDLEQLYVACRAQTRSSTGIFNDNFKTLAPVIPTPTPTPQPVVTSTIFPQPKSPTVTVGQQLYGSPADDVSLHIRNKAAALPLSSESVNHLCVLGNQLLENPKSNLLQLYEDFGYFSLGNDMQVKLDGVQHAALLYNMACCCSRMSLLKPSLSPMFSTTTSSTTPKWCQDTNAVRGKAMSWLVAAVGAGWTDYKHMNADPDLQPVRSHYSAGFATVIKMAEQSHKGF